MEHFDPSLVPLPICPEDGVLRRYLAYPSVAIVYALVALLGAAFAVATLAKYNAVEVYNVYRFPGAPIRDP